MVVSIILSSVSNSAAVISISYSFPTFLHRPNQLFALRLMYGPVIFLKLVSFLFQVYSCIFQIMHLIFRFFRASKCTSWNLFDVKLGIKMGFIATFCYGHCDKPLHLLIYIRYKTPAAAAAFIMRKTGTRI